MQLKRHRYRSIKDYWKAGKIHNFGDIWPEHEKEKVHKTDECVEFCRNQAIVENKSLEPLRSRKWELSRVFCNLGWNLTNYKLLYFRFKFEGFLRDTATVPEKSNFTIIYQNNRNLSIRSISKCIDIHGKNRLFLNQM